jgi:hypothetical protein
VENNVADVTSQAGGAQDVEMLQNKKKKGH